MNYKDDDSFFTTVFPPFVYYGWNVKSWLLENENAKYRYIRDYEIEQEFWNVEQINEVYEGIKTIAIVVNPWARTYYVYQQLLEMKNNNDNRLIDINQLELENFTKFVESLPSFPSEIGNFWFSLTTPVCKWADNADYILKDTSMQEDFRPIQDYFLSNDKLNVLETIDYQDFYNDKTKKIVATIFKEDIEQFGYIF